MTSQEFQRLTYEVLGCSFSIAFLLGFLTHRSHFCTMGAIADVASAVTTFGFGVLCVSDQIDPTQTLYFSTKWYWASTLLGGFLFGLGMVFSSGCGLKSLVRAGAGNLKSLVVLIVMGVFAFMTLKGIFATLRVASVDRLSLSFLGGANWSNLLGFSSNSDWGWFAVVLSSLCLIAIIFQNLRQASHLMSGFLVGLLFIAIWWVCGHLGFVAEHPDSLETVYAGSKSGRLETFSFVAPVAYFLNWLEFYTDQSNVLSTGVVSVMGVFLGSLFSALLSSTFKWEGFTRSEDLGFHLFGAAMMGVGGVLALGCSVGQGISGISTLSINASSALLGIIIGAVAALQLRSELVDSSDI